MPIKIEITAETPAELAAWYQQLAAGVGSDSVVIQLDEPHTDEVKNAMVQAMVEEQAAPAPEPAPKRTRGRPAKEAPAMAPDEAAKAVHDHVPAEHKPVGLDDCLAAMRRVSEGISFDATRALLTKFGVPKISALDPSRHAEFVAAADAMLAEQAA